EWKFKDAASSVKMFTGKEYPAREYVHTITLHDDRTITGPLSGVVYVQAETDRQRSQAERFILHKRAKGGIDETLKSLKYVKQIRVGTDALTEGRRKAEQQNSKKTTYSADIAYKFSVNGRDYVGGDVLYGGKISSSKRNSAEKMTTDSISVDW
ncbi:MAG: hypothetical protein HQ567_01115, partial [Candidatus Nealsonbacteria bacterium]|nr:hypothetical protein [Candidatus Nealsonbacteria bacterium]